MLLGHMCLQKFSPLIILFKCKNILYASDYFPKMFELAIRLIKKKLAYVDDQTSNQIQKNRINPTPAKMRSEGQLNVHRRPAKYPDIRMLCSHALRVNSV